MRQHAHRRVRSLGRALSLTFCSAPICLAAAPFAHASFPGPDGAIAFESGTTTNDILVMGPDGSGVRNLTRTCARREFGPDWSPDGSRLAYGFGEGRVAGIAIISRDGAPVGEFRPKPSGGARWAPDGSRFVFSAVAPGGFTDIFVVNADGSGQRNLTNTAMQHEGAPAWSPDGSKIVFTGSDPARAGYLLYTIDPTGANRTQLTSNSQDGNYDAQPEWSPDGAKIVFARATSPGSGSSGVYVIASSGGDPTLLPGVPGSGPFSWSPSGAKIAFVGPDLGGVWTMNADGSDRRKLNGTNTRSVDWGSAQTYGGAPGRCVSGGPVRPFGRLTRVRYGVAWVLGCPAPAALGNRCLATLRLASNQGPRRGRAARALGRARGSISANRRKRLVVRLNRAGRALLRRRGRLAVRVSAEVRYRIGRQPRRLRGRRSMVLRAPKNRR